MAQRGRKPIGTHAMHHTVTIPLPFPLWAAIKNDAEREGRSVAATIRLHLHAALMVGESKG